MLPRLDGLPIRVVVRRDLGPHLAATSIPRRLIQLDSAVLARQGDFERIVIHELFHFVWIRLSNASRREWSDLLAAEFARGSRGELGWSAEWRKNKLTGASGPPWRRYIRESFCDTAAWRYSALPDHDEFTLAARERKRRRAWFARHCAGILKV